MGASGGQVQSFQKWFQVAQDFVSHTRPKFRGRGGETGGHPVLVQRPAQLVLGRRGHSGVPSFTLRPGAPRLGMRVRPTGRRGEGGAPEIQKSCFLAQIKARLYPAALLLFSLPPPPPLPLRGPGIPCP